MFLTFLIICRNSKKKTGGESSGDGNTKLKILCLHGYRQTSTSFYEKLGAFRKLVGKKCVMKLVNAPHLVPNDSEQVGCFKTNVHFSNG